MGARGEEGAPVGCAAGASAENGGREGVAGGKTPGSRFTRTHGPVWISANTAREWRPKKRSRAEPPAGGSLCG